MKTFVIHIIIYFTFYIIGAYATTDILRLLKNCAVSVNTPHCYCPICHKKIALKDQLPIISYIKNNGQCRNCKSHIPISDLFLEFFLFFTLSCIATLWNFSWLAYLLCLLWYEGTKIAFLIIYGHRQESFYKNLLVSLGNNAVIFLMVAILFLFAQLA